MELHKERYHEVICDILHLVQEIQQENVCAYVREMKWSYQLLEHLLRDFRVETEIPDTEFPMMQNVLFYISQHYTEALTLAALAEQFFVSSSYISKMFREKLDTSFLKYINEIRLLHAAAFLSYLCTAAFRSGHIHNDYLSLPIHYWKNLPDRF